MANEGGPVTRTLIKDLCDGPNEIEGLHTKVRGAFKEMAEGIATESQKGALLIALKLKRGHDPIVVNGAVEEMLAHANLCEDWGTTLDIVGTGGDGVDTFNVSTAAGLVVASFGLRVAKHGNRAASSKCGSADLLEAMGADLSVSPRGLKEVIEQANYAFLFAQVFHPSMANVAKARKQIGTRTIFNILGPLMNPTSPKVGVFGVYQEGLGPVMAEVLKMRGVDRAIVCWGQCGLDEISPEGKTSIWEIKNGAICQYEVHPVDDFGAQIHKLTDMQGGDAQYNRAIFNDILDGKERAEADFVCIQAAALLYVAGRVETLKDGFKEAKNALLSGAAKATVQKYIELTRQIGAQEKASS
eukprot:Clim_evm26s227 gene=Clim_evmTU26s227